MMIFSAWCQAKLFSSDRVERHFAYLTSLVCATTALYIICKPIGQVSTWGAPLCTLWAGGLILATLLNVYYDKMENKPRLYVTQFSQFLLLMLVVPVYYDGTNVVNRYRYAQDGDALLYDEQLLQMDKQLLGWAFPHGQLALWLDGNTAVGVTTAFGRVVAEFLQIMYVSYYFWGNALGVYLAYLYFYQACYKQEKSSKKKLQWRRLQMFVTAWVSGFLFNFLLNLLFPAVSPRIYLKSYYVNDVEGLWVTAWLRGALTSAASGTFSAFPSGHCGQSWLTAILAYRIGYKGYAAINVVAATAISLATLVLRYHYFVDFLFSSVTIAFGVYLGSFHSATLYSQLLSRSAAVMSTDEVEELSLMEKGEGLISVASISPASSPLNQRSTATPSPLTVLTHSPSANSLAALQAIAAASSPTPKGNGEVQKQQAQD